MSNRNLATSRTITVGAMIFAALVLLPMRGSAQNNVAATSTGPWATGATTTAKGAADDRYRIGAGDVLDIRVFNRPTLTRESVRVDARGTIRMPMIEGELQAVCRTESELAEEIATRYLKFQRNPHVDVFVKEFVSKPTAVMGAVAKPGPFQLQRRVRLLELLSLAGGTTERAGEEVLITRSSEVYSCSGETTEATASSLTFNLNRILTGEESSNPYLHPGDIVTVQQADEVYVVGNVVRPMTIALKEPISISRAIAMAGGTMPDSKTDRVRIVRQVPGSMTKAEIFIDLKAIDKHGAADIALQANDIVDVPTSTGKRILRTLLNTIAPAAAQFPLRIIR
ncbi:MAG: polysaccharide biosynthesis/export protein [Blastocatellia bacterium]|jgi:polysaccharide export outer membrane protein|nr:polysaccharide biosynthesis/export protein [Blastocatellia bacterium]